MVVFNLSGSNMIILGKINSGNAFLNSSHLKRHLYRQQVNVSQDKDVGREERLPISAELISFPYSFGSSIQLQ